MRVQIPLQKAPVLLNLKAQPGDEQRRENGNGQQAPCQQAARVIGQDDRRQSAPHIGEKDARAEDDKRDRCQHGNRGPGNHLVKGVHAVGCSASAGSC